MSRISKSHIAVLLAIGAIVPMQSLGPRPGLAETVGNGVANGFAATAISDPAAGPAGTTAIGGIAIGPDSSARTHIPARVLLRSRIADMVTLPLVSHQELPTTSPLQSASSARPPPSTVRRLAAIPMLSGAAASPQALVRPLTASSRSPLGTAPSLLTQRSRSAVRRTRAVAVRLPWDKAPRRPAVARLRPVLRPTPRETTP
jgi:hypothetical protein